MRGNPFIFAAAPTDMSAPLEPATTKQPPQRHANGEESSRRLVEVGWILLDDMGEVQRKAAVECRTAVKARLEEEWPGFLWRLPIVNGQMAGAKSHREPVASLEKAAAERNTQHWDFAVLITDANLASHYRAEANAAVSRALATIVVSTSGLAERPIDPSSDVDPYRAALVRRMGALILHNLGHLNSLGHREDASNFMSAIESVEDLDRFESFDAAQKEQFADELDDVADKRLEEDHRYGALWPSIFYLMATWINRKEIGKALLEAKPWQFPFRFSRLTAAATSAMLVLIVTAEVWELASRQTGAVVSLLSVVAVATTTLDIVVRQRLFLPRQRRLKELIVMTNVSTFLIVSAGMITTYLLMVAFASALGASFFSARLLHNWTGVALNSVGADDYFRLASFVASLSIFIGALGAGFERHAYFRHVIFVDEEM